MKANRSGSYAEQVRYRDGWLTPGQVMRSQQARCHNCAHASMQQGGGNPRCTLSQYSTLRRAWCQRHEAVGEVAR